MIPKSRDASRPEAVQPITVAFLGDVMLAGRASERITAGAPVFASDVLQVLGTADQVVVNLECCLTRSDVRWSDAGKKFFFRAPPEAAKVLADAGVGVASLANNHSLDFGVRGLTDTITALTDAGIEPVGAGTDARRAQAPIVLDVHGRRLGVVAVTDHPVEFAAGPDRPGVAYADLSSGVPSWLLQQVRALAGHVDISIVTPHWGPNFLPTPRASVVRAAAELIAAGATIVAGHSAHVMQPVRPRVLYDLGDAINDYPPHPLHRADLGAVWLVGFPADDAPEFRAIPTVVRDGQMEFASGSDRRFTVNRLTALCMSTGAHVDDRDGELHFSFVGPEQPT